VGGGGPDFFAGASGEFEMYRRDCVQCDGWLRRVLSFWFWFGRKDDRRGGVLVLGGWSSRPRWGFSSEVGWDGMGWDWVLVWC